MNPKLQRTYGKLLKSLVLPSADLIMGQRMMQRLSFLQQAQWWHRERIYEYRDNLLRQTMIQAFEVPFYRDLMQERGIRPQDIRSAEDLVHLPVVNKQMLRPGFPHRTTRNTGQRTYNECSSGSTGEPFCVKEDNYTAGWYRATFMLALHWAGWSFGEPHLQTGMSLKRHNGRKLKDWIMLTHYESAYDLTNAHLDQMLDTICNHQLKHLWGYPGSLYQLSVRAIETGRKHKLSTAVTWGDMVYPIYRKTIKDAFDVDVTDTYGCAEGIQIAAQTQGSEQYLIHNFDVIVEYLDDRDKPVQVGTPGNLVLTRLHAGPTPLIRYRVGDMGVSGGSQLPEDGRGFEVMERIQGRDTDIIVTPSGNRLIVHFFTGILEHFREIDAFQVLQQKGDELILRIVPNENFNDDVSMAVIHQLRNKGADIQIRVELVDEIPLTPGGKRRFVIRETLS